LPFLKQNKDEDIIEFRIAKELADLPKLPVVVDAGLFPMLTEQEHAVHGIAMDDYEYRAKLKAQLDNFIASDELIQEIVEKAFTGRLFLSYRKKDIDHARAFMKAFHDVPGFGSIANFLTAGRVFDDEIRMSIDAADVFVLLVTPNITEEGNYVMEHEYPYARKKTKKIIAIEMIPPTDMHKFQMEYKQINKYVKHEDMQEAFCSILPTGAVLDSIDTERGYLLGQAFLRGIMVESYFEKAMRLLVLSTEQESEFAMKSSCLIADIYEEGIRTKTDYQKALTFQERAYMLCKDELQKSDIALSLAGLCLNMCKYKDGADYCNSAISVKVKMLGVEHPDLVVAYQSISNFYLAIDDYDNAFSFSLGAARICNKAYGNGDIRTADSYMRLAFLYNYNRDNEKALAMCIMALPIYEKIYGTDDFLTAKTYQQTAIIYKDMGEYEKALKFFSKSLLIQERDQGTGNPQLIYIYNSMGVLYENMKNYNEALDMHNKALRLQEEYLGPDDLGTALIYNNIGTVYFSMKSYKKALELYLHAYPIIQRICGVWHTNSQQTVNSLYKAYIMLGGVRGQSRVWSDSSCNMKVIYNDIASLYEWKGDKERAKELYAIAEEISS